MRTITITEELIPSFWTRLALGQTLDETQLRRAVQDLIERAALLALLFESALQADRHDVELEQEALAVTAEIHDLLWPAVTLLFFWAQATDTDHPTPGASQ